MLTRPVNTPTISRLVGDQPAMELAPDFVVVVDLPNGPRRVRQGWLCEAKASDGTSQSEVMEGCTERQAWLVATGLGLQMSLREELRDKRERGHSLLQNPALLHDQGGGKLFKWVQALDTVECFKDRRRDVKAFRASDHGTGEMRPRRSDSDGLNVSPWLRTPDPSTEAGKKERAWLQVLARAFPEYPWADDLR